jgi:UDPglucose 6-dehydrogenase
VQAYDPEAMKVAKGIFGDEDHLRDKSYDALKGADALAIVTEWNEFREPDFAGCASCCAAGHLRRPQHLQPEQMKAQGFTYLSIGR